VTPQVLGAAGRPPRVRVAVSSSPRNARWVPRQQCPRGEAWSLHFHGVFDFMRWVAHSPWTSPGFGGLSSIIGLPHFRASAEEGAVHVSLSGFERSPLTFVVYLALNKCIFADLLSPVVCLLHAGDYWKTQSGLQLLLHSIRSCTFCGGYWTEMSHFAHVLVVWRRVELCNGGASI
jgi:hypothetical protein